MIFARFWKASYRHIAVADCLNLEDPASLGDTFERYMSGHVWLHRLTHLRSIQHNTYPSNAEYTASSKVKTWAGSLTELHAVKPSMSANNTVALGNRSAIGFDLKAATETDELVACATS